MQYHRTHLSPEAVVTMSYVTRTHSLRQPVTFITIADAPTHSCSELSPFSCLLVPCCSCTQLSLYWVVSVPTNNCIWQFLCPIVAVLSFSLTQMPYCTQLAHYLVVHVSSFRYFCTHTPYNNHPTLSAPIWCHV